jgi:RNA polymerase sigma factor (sigma-70 family)
VFVPSTDSGCAPSLTPSSWPIRIGARGGRDARAIARLIAEYLPRLRRWAHGRLPRWARSIADTADLVQDALVGTLTRLDAFEPRGRRALAAYLRQAVHNRVCDEHRRIARRGLPLALSESLVDPHPSPLDQAMTSETEARYRAALAHLSPAEQEVIVAHVELDYTHEQLACMLGRSRDAARMVLRRAIGRLAERMRER